MSAHRFFLEAPLPDADGPVHAPLTEEDVRHAVRVLRVRPGEPVELVDPSGTFASVAEVVSAGTSGLTVRVTGRLDRDARPRVTLVQGVAKGEKMDAIVRQATEVGAARIVPVLTERCVVKLDARKRVERGERWQRIARSAAEQSRRFEVPTVEDPRPLSEFIGSIGSFDAVLVLWEEAGGAGIAAVLAEAARGESPSVALVIGPEGGLSATEVEALESAGARVASLGPSILRTETAAVVSVAITLHALGGLGDA